MLGANVTTNCLAAKRRALWQLLQRRLRRSRQHAARRREARAMARAIPRLLGAIPSHLAAHVRADRRELRHLARIAAIRRDPLALQLEDAAFAALERAQASSLRPGESIADQIIRIVDVFLEIVPRAAEQLGAAW